MFFSDNLLLIGRVSNILKSPMFLQSPLYPAHTAEVVIADMYKLNSRKVMKLSSL